VSDHRKALTRTAQLVRAEIFPEIEEDAISDFLITRRVRLVADERNLACAGGQTAVIATAIAVAQTGARVGLDMPAVPLVGDQPPLPAGVNLRAGLEALLGDLINPRLLGPQEPADVAIVFGDTAVPGCEPDAAVLVVGGGAWHARLRPAPDPRVGRWSTDVPFGPLLAAVAACAETFRTSMGALGLATGQEPTPQHRIGPAGAVDLELEPVELANLAQLHGDAISAGAITNAALAALWRVEELAGTLRTADADTGERSNLNRYIHLRGAVLGEAKVQVLADLAPERLRIDPVDVRVTDETIEDLVPLADHVIVGVDDIPSRWLVQRHAPGWVCVGGTSRMEVVVSEHRPDTPCAGCMHPQDEDNQGFIPTVSFVSLLAGVIQAHRLVHYVATNKTLPAVIAYGLGLDGPQPLFPLGQLARADCPVGCAASRAAREAA